MPFKIRLRSFEQKRPVVSADVQQSCKTKAQHWRQKNEMDPQDVQCMRHTKNMKRHELDSKELKIAKNKISLEMSIFCEEI